MPPTFLELAKKRLVEAEAKLAKAEDRLSEAIFQDSVISFLNERGSRADRQTLREEYGVES